MIEAADGRQASGVLQAHADEIDLIVTELIMPNGSGEELLLEARRIRRCFQRLSYQRSGPQGRERESEHHGEAVFSGRPDRQGPESLDSRGRDFAEAFRGRRS